ncbi:MAG: substrate-binding region of ABC-type glycine betaine transport system [Rhodoferax sp.]|nr:substrate-binding region of ABC-type glycine betaine transport system [Rhodoferax sp.]
MKNWMRCVGLVAAVVGVPPAMAQDADSCKKVRFVDIGWSDITATTALATTVFEGLGYATSTTIASVPISLAGLKSKQIDVSLGYWSPVQDAMIEPMVKAKTLSMLPTPNLSGAKATLAVPAYAAEAGLKSFADIAKFQKELDGKIFGIEAGSSANAKVQAMIDKNELGLGGFKLVQSSEAGMLAEVQRAVRQKRPVVFVGWEPHPMNIQMQITYLSGGDASFGPNFGEARVNTLVANDYLDRCPNAGKLLSNLVFSTDIENRLMVPIVGKVLPATAAKDFLKQNPELLPKWLAGVKTFDGQEGLPAVRTSLGL